MISFQRRRFKEVEALKSIPENHYLLGSQLRVTHESKVERPLLSVLW